MSDDTLRLSTAEREQASTRLADHFAEGRLDHEEYSERLDRIWAARTAGDLRPVFRDLPGPGPGLSRRPRAVVARRRGRLPFPFVLLAVLVVGAVTLTHLPIVLIGLGVWFFLVRGRWRAVRGHRRW